MRTLVWRLLLAPAVVIIAATAGCTAGSVDNPATAKEMGRCVGAAFTVKHTPLAQPVRIDPAKKHWRAPFLRTTDIKLTGTPAADGTYDIVVTASAGYDIDHVYVVAKARDVKVKGTVKHQPARTVNVMARRAIKLDEAAEVPVFKFSGTIDQLLFPLDTIVITGRRLYIPDGAGRSGVGTCPRDK